MMPQLQSETPVAEVAVPKQWSLATRIGFRFVFAYFLLYVSPGPVGALSPYHPANELDRNIFVWVWHKIVPWVGVNILHLSSSQLAEAPNGSGDELYDYVLILCLLVTAVLITAIWSWWDRKRPNYEVLHRWLRLWMRMTVAWSMLGYGIKKLIGAQFTPPNLAKQIQPFGRTTPMGMLWTFMGASQAYSLFGGIGETLGGVLLVLPALTTLGALVSLAMMTNVLMLNMFYDVPRKIFSVHLVLMCLFLLLPDVRRLTNVLVLNRRADPVPEGPLFRDKLLNFGALLLPILFGAYVLWAAGTQSVRDLKEEIATLPPPVHGVWSVGTMVVNGIVPADNERWQDVVFDNPKILIVQLQNGRQAKFGMNMDSDLQHVSLHVDDPRWKGAFNLKNSGPNQMILDGEFGGRHVVANLQRLDLSDPNEYPLVNRPFRWVNPNVDNP